MAGTKNHDYHILPADPFPIIGAFVSRPSMTKTAYHNPKDVNETELKKWMMNNAGDRKPASVDAVKVNSTILRLRTIQTKSTEQHRQPWQNDSK